MVTREFQYELPEELIAQRPLPERGSSRLLYVPAGQAPQHYRFPDLRKILRPGDLLVFNNSRVIPARLYGHKPTGGKVELLVERIESELQGLCHVRASKAPGVGNRILFADGVSAEVIAREQDLFRLKFTAPVSLLVYLDMYGHIPLPPYIQREDEQVDRARYQTVYAKQPGAVAAPTAGLHFDQVLLEQLARDGIEMCEITLHVGAGTFQPVRVEDVRQHRMHAEWIDVPVVVCQQIEATRRRGGRVVAVGTTVVRSLETAASSGALRPYQGDTEIFITPGYPFKTIDALLTNFHLPCSTLLMLVCAFAGYSQVMQAYQLAVSQQYRFFSYGDAMFLERYAEALVVDSGSGGCK